MPLVGDSRLFGVEYELNEQTGGAWLFGKVCFWIAGERVGDFELGTSLRDFLFQVEQGRRYKGDRQTGRFMKMPAADVVATIEAGLFGRGSEEKEQLAVDEQWAKHRITPEIDVFDSWRIYLFQSSLGDRVLYSRTEPGANIREVLLPLGECDAVLARCCNEIGAIYEAENGAASDRGE
jgi:hypothetical protein